MGIPFYRPKPAPAAAFGGKNLPDQSANFISRLFFFWLFPLLKVGYSRPLQADDVWNNHPNMRAKAVGDSLQDIYQARLPPSMRTAEYRLTPDQNVMEKRPKMTDSELRKKFGWRTARKVRNGKWIEEDGQVYDLDLWWSLFLNSKRDLLTAVSLLLVSYGVLIVLPLISRALIAEMSRATAIRIALNNGESIDSLTPPRSVEYSVGLAVLLTFIFGGQSFFNAHAFRRWQTAQLDSRTGLLDIVSRKSMRLSNKAKQEFPSGRINTIITSDINYFTWVWQDVVIFIVLIPQLLAGTALFIWILGYSALAGIAVLLLSGPLQVVAMNRYLKLRLRQLAAMDVRVRLLTEVINNIRAVKLYAYEKLFGTRIAELRDDEMAVCRPLNAWASASIAMMDITPTVAAVVSFIVYSASGHTLDAATIFTAFQFLSIMRLPIGWFPRIIAAVLDCYAAEQRLRAFLRAEEAVAELNIDFSANFAIDVSADFQHEFTGKNNTKPEEEYRSVPSSHTNSRSSSSTAVDTAGLVLEKATQTGFTLKDINLQVPRGSLVCIVGRIGSGKSTLLGGMVNEVRRSSGHCVFGGTISYVPQQAWVQSGTIRDNITFSADTADVDLDRVKQVSAACGLSTDLAALSHGDLTVVGERGITLSGGQRQRICIARAAYTLSDIVLLDDPLSAVDAQVGHHLLLNCILNGPLSDRTRILVTHSLEVLPIADLVLMMEGDSTEGKIVQQGTYKQLMGEDGPFRTLIEEHGATASSAEVSEEYKQYVEDKNDKTVITDDAEDHKLHIDEERESGSIAWSTYTAYIKHSGSPVKAVAVLMIYIVTQCGSIATMLWLGWWSQNQFQNLSNGAYMGIYAGIGSITALGMFFCIYWTAILGLRSSFAMTNIAWEKVMRSSVIWHDRTPTGRIISRLSKDVLSTDVDVYRDLYYLLTNIAIMAGSFALMIYVFPWLGLTGIPLAIFLYLLMAFFQPSYRELKRVEALERSHLYSGYTEQLAGLSVIKAFNRISHFERLTQQAIDRTTRIMSTKWSLDCWIWPILSIAASMLLGAVAIYGAASRDSVDAAQFGVGLTYILSCAMRLSDLIFSVTMLQDSMNGVERFKQYTQLETEAAPTGPIDPPESDWPSKGTMAFQDVHLKYRAELPTVLKGLTFEIKAGEKIGIVGRTGAGKSSLVQAIYRTVELHAGKIFIDGVELAGLGLDTLRSRLSIIPQESFLFEGTVRANIDPAGNRSDAALNDALSLIHSNPSASASLREKFRLETAVQNEGANFSAGERQLLALIRALVRGCKILVLDEATSSVDPETDALIQRIIQTEFSNITLMSIAHRLQTVIFYDRILVMDAGQVAEFDTPLNLFDQTTSIFRSLCDTKKISREDILRIRADAGPA